jgi:hypothetical protein
LRGSHQANRWRRRKAALGQKTWGAEGALEGTSTQGEGKNRKATHKAQVYHIHKYDAERLAKAIAVESTLETVRALPGRLRALSIP